MIELRGNRFGINNTPEEILAIAEEIAGKYDLSSQYTQPYYLWDHTTIRRINWFSISSLRRYLGAWRRHGIPKRIPSSCGAETLRVKNHYLGFYPPKGVLIKVFLDPDAYQTHVEGIERFNHFGFQYISAPLILHKAIEPIPHTVERFIPGRNFLEQPLDLPKEFLEELANFHFDRPEIIKIEIDDNERIQISDILASIDLEKDHATAIKGILDKGSWQVVFGEVHGDFSLGNLIQGREGIFLTDWEGYSRGPIAQDLIKLYRGGGSELRSWILNIYQGHQDSISGEGNTDVFGSALLLFTLRLLPSLQSSALEQFERVLKDEEEAKKRVSEYKASLKEVLLSLLD